MLERLDKRLGSGLLAVDPNAEARFVKMMDDFHAAAQKYVRPPSSPVAVKIRTWRMKMDTRTVQMCLHAAARIDEKGFVRSLPAVAREMRMSYTNLRLFLGTHQGLREHLNLQRHPDGMPAFVRSKPA